MCDRSLICIPLPAIVSTANALSFPPPDYFLYLQSAAACASRSPAGCATVAWDACSMSHLWSTFVYLVIIECTVESFTTVSDTSEHQHWVAQCSTSSSCLAALSAIRNYFGHLEFWVFRSKRRSTSDVQVSQSLELKWRLTALNQVLRSCLPAFKWPQHKHILIDIFTSDQALCCKSINNWDLLDILCEPCFSRSLFGSNVAFLRLQEAEKTRLSRVNVHLVGRPTGTN